MKIAHLSVGDALTTRLVNWQSKLGHIVHLIMLEPEWEKLEGVKKIYFACTETMGVLPKCFLIKKTVKENKT